MTRVVAAAMLLAAAHAAAQVSGPHPPPAPTCTLVCCVLPCTVAGATGMLLGVVLTFAIVGYAVRGKVKA